MYALIINNEKITLGSPPTGARRLDTSAWVTPPKDGWTPDLLAACGWHEVTETPRPAPVEGGVHESTVELVDGLPVRVWTWRAWTAEEIASQAEAEQQQARYETHEAILDATAALMADAHADGEPWVQPTAAHDSYPLGITVTHGGKTWENLTPANVWQPGVSGWREQVAQGYPAWVAPTGGHDAYKKGARVSFEGSNYESLIDANVWSPTGYPAGWRKL